MIRQATKYDKNEIVKIIEECYLEEDFDTKVELGNYDYYNAVFSSIVAGMGVIFIEQGKGVIVAVINHSIFDPKTLILNCIAWVVRKQYRNTTVAYRLLKSYIEYAEQLKAEGRIKYYTIGKTSKTPNLDYAKLGFRKTDETWAR